MSCSRVPLPLAENSPLTACSPPSGALLSLSDWRTFPRHILQCIRKTTLCGIVSINSDIPSSDLEPDKFLIESDTDALSEINNGICAVSSNTGHENRPSAALVNCLGGLNCSRGESLPDDLSWPVPIGRFNAALGIGQRDEMHSLANLTVKMARHHLAAVDRKRRIVAD